MVINYKKKISIKIPINISVFYSKQKSVIVFKNRIKTRFLSINQGLILTFIGNQISIFVNPFIAISNNTKKKLNFLKKTLLSFFKHFLIECQVSIYNKLKLVGVGYKVFKTNFKNILLFKLGFSHPIYFRLDFTISIIKSTKLFVMSSFYQNSSRALSLVRALKLPEPYKGKGILYDNEVIKIKEGKKI